MWGGGGIRYPLSTIQSDSKPIQNNPIESISKQSNPKQFQPIPIPVQTLRSHSPLRRCSLSDVMLYLLAISNIRIRCPYPLSISISKKKTEEPGCPNPNFPRWCGGPGSMCCKSKKTKKTCRSIDVVYVVYAVLPYSVSQERKGRRKVDFPIEPRKRKMAD